MPGAGQRLLGGGDRADAHDLRRAAGDRDGLDPRQRLQAVLVRVGLAAHQHGGGAIGQRRGGAGGHRAVLVERRLQPGEAFGCRVGADAAVLIDRTALAGDRHDLVVELAGGDRGGRALVAAHRERLLLGARDLPLAGDILGGLAHADIGGGHRLHQRRVEQRVVAHHRHAAHALDAGADENVAGAECDLAGRDVDRLHRRAAEAVDGDAGDRQRQVRQQPDQAGDVQPLLALRERAADDDVLDILGLDAGAADQRPDHLRGQIVGAHPGQAALAGEMERRAGVARDDGVGHWLSPCCRAVDPAGWRARLARGAGTFSAASAWAAMSASSARASSIAWRCARSWSRRLATAASSTRSCACWVTSAS